MKIIVEDYNNTQNNWFYLKGHNWYFNISTGYTYKIEESEQ